MSDIKGTAIRAPAPSRGGFLVGPALAGAIKTLIDQNERAVSSSPVTRIQTRFEEPIRPARLNAFRICTFTGAWAIDSLKTVTFKYQTSTPNTVVATNLFCGLSPSAGTCDVSIAKDGTAWFLVQPNLTQLPGYSASGTQVLTIINGNLQFVGTTTCGTTAA